MTGDTAPPRLTDEELAALEVGHFGPARGWGGVQICIACQNDWPCLDSRVLAELRRLRAELAAQTAPRPAWRWLPATLVLGAAKPPSLKCRCGRPVFLALDDLTPYCPGCEFGPCETCDCAP